MLCIQYILEFTFISTWTAFDPVKGSSVQLTDHAVIWPTGLVMCHMITIPRKWAAMSIVHVCLKSLQCSSTAVRGALMSVCSYNVQLGILHNKIHSHISCESQYKRFQTLIDIFKVQRFACQKWSDGNESFVLSHIHVVSVGQAFREPPDVGK